MVWEYNYGYTQWSSASAYGLIALDSGHCICAGFDTTIGLGFIFELDDTGAAVSGKQEILYGSNEALYDAKMSHDDKYLFAGHKDSSSGFVTAYLLKLDTAFTTEWEKRPGADDSVNDVIYKMAMTLDGGYVLVGSRTMYDSTKSDVLVIKVDSTGNDVWVETFGYNGDDVGRSIRATDDSGFVVTGYSNSFSGTDDAYTLVIDKNGDLVRQYWHGDSGVQKAHDLEIITDSLVILAGEEDGDFYLNKFDFTVEFESWCGDVDHDGDVDLVDINYLSAYIYSNGPPPIPLESGNVDCETGINLLDMLYLIDYLYDNGDAPCDCK